MVDAILGGLSYLTNPTYWVAVIIAVSLAVLTGVIPGFNAILVMALAIPFIIVNIHDPVIGLVLLATITGVNNTLDSIPAVLLGNPGAGTQVTFLEGHQLARRGLAAYTLGGVYAVSAIGGLVGALVLALVIPVIRPVVVRVSHPEIAALALFGVAMVSALSRGAMLKGLIAGFVGILLSTIGIDAVTGMPRFTFDQLFLWEGLPLIATTIGVFALPEMIDLTMTRKSISPPDSVISTREVWRGAKDGFKRWPMTVRQSLFGVFLGMVPGVGAAVIDWLAYVFGIFLSKDRTQFGKGSFEGVLFAESAQNSKEAGQAVPTLALGVPGGLAWALVLAAMLSYNVTPGAAMFSRYADLTIALVITLAIGNLMVTMIGIAATGQLAKLTLIPYPLIGGVIIPVSILAAFADKNNYLAVVIVIAFAAIGLVMKVFQWPRPPLILGFILGRIIETNLQSTYSIYGLTGFLTRPLTVALLIAGVAIGYFFYKMGASSSAMVQQATGGAVPPSGAAESAPPAQTRLRFHWRQWDNLIALAVIGVAVAFIVGAQDYVVRAQRMPTWIGSLVIVLAVAQILKASLRRQTGPVEILDIGMRSLMMEGAARIGAIVAALFGVMVLVSFLFGLQYGTVAYAFLAPAITMRGKWRWIGAVVSVAFVYLFIFVVLEYFAHVIWPEPILGQWILNRF